MTRIDRRADLAAHLLRRDQSFSIEMAATFRKVLVFDLYAMGAHPLEATNRARHVECVAVAGVGVDDEMGVDPIADQRERIGNLAHADQTDIRPAEPGIGDGGAGDIQRGETCLRGDQRRERVIDTGRHHDRLPVQARAQRFRIGHGYIPR